MLSGLTDGPGNIETWGTKDGGDGDLWEKVKSECTLKETTFKECLGGSVRLLLKS